MLSTIGAYVLIIVYFATDAGLRSGERAKSIAVEKTDQKSTQYLLYSFLVSIVLLLLAPLINYLRLGQLAGGWFPGWIGEVLMLFGIVLRIWATKVLGRFYTRILLTSADHRIVQSGPYRIVRHPGYSGSLLVWIGAGLATSNWIVFVIITLVCGISYYYRIQNEEAMLLDKFGKEYEEYTRRTTRVIPFIY
jgi:protein-S-isoprenylcysteine O-methyltransferase Ste14